MTNKKRELKNPTLSSNHRKKRHLYADYIDAYRDVSNVIVLECICHQPYDLSILYSSSSIRLICPYQTCLRSFPSLLIHIYMYSAFYVKTKKFCKSHRKKFRSDSFYRVCVCISASNTHSSIYF